MKCEWQKVCEGTTRLQVWGGWKVSTVLTLHHHDVLTGSYVGESSDVTSIFVPDPKHEWEITPTEKEGVK